ncbi:MAG: SRPBCC family protein [Bacteroidia bacterium]
MKIIKGLLYFILVVVVIIAVAALFAPSEKTVERETIIDAPASQVYAQVANFENWQNWDPWFKRDTSQTREFNGSPGDEGYGYSWKSDHKQVGNGSMTITSQEENVNTNYHIVMGDEGQSMEMDGGWTFEEVDGKTKVTWNMKSELGFPMKLMHYMTEKWVGPDFEAGLANLKEYVESMPDAPEAPAVEIVTEFGVNYAIVKDLVNFSDFEGFFHDAYPAIYSYLGENGVEAKGPPSALYYTWDTTNQQSECAAAVAISDAIAEETTATTIAVGEATLGANSITYAQMGDYEQSMASHNALGAWLEENEKTFAGPVIEQYVVGPTTAENPADYHTNIVYHFE